MIHTGGPVTVSVAGLNPIVWMFSWEVPCEYAIRPSPERLIDSASEAAVVTGCGEPSTFPDRSSIGTRQIFMTPLRSLTK